MNTLEKTEKTEYWLQILKENGEAGARAKEKELRNAGVYRKNQDIAHERATMEFRELEGMKSPRRREPRVVRILRKRWIAIAVVALAAIAALSIVVW